MKTDIVVRVDGYAAEQGAAAAKGYGLVESEEICFCMRSLQYSRARNACGAEATA
ncbi:MAG: hypothetical protein JSW03_10590 [Candidatus Eiseniibacteriota bacterium]|nr:MAG: hypothetical protein JSW03_10590 [Candidatus Eisenbacteria bacterium]